MKKIVSVVLTLALIFMFVACEVTTPTLYGKKVMSVTVASAPAYFEGETINPADITLRVVYDNGETTVNAADAGLIPAEGSDYTADAEKTHFTVAYGFMSSSNSSSNGSYAWDIYIPTQTITGITVNTSAAKTEIAEGTRTVDTTGVTYTAQYVGGSKAIPATLAESKITYTLSFDEDGKTATVKAEGKDGITITMANWTLAVVKDTSKVIDSVKLVPDADQEFFAINGTFKADKDTAAAAATLESVEYTIEAYNAVGEKIGELDAVDSVAAVDATSKAFVDFDLYAETQALNDEKINNIAATVTVMVDGETVEKPATLVINYVDDYVTEFTVEDGDNVSTYKPGQTINKAEFVFTASAWASGYEYEGTEASKNSLQPSWFNFEPSFIKKGYSGTSFTITDVVVNTSTAPDYVDNAVVKSGFAGLTVEVNPS